MLLKQKSSYILLWIVTTHYKWSKNIIIILPLKLFHYKISLFQRYLSFLYPQRKAPRHIDCILPHSPHRQVQ
jgi:hypothetical protein